MLEAWLVVLLEWGLVDLDTLGFDDGANLEVSKLATALRSTGNDVALTFVLNLARSIGLRVSALAMTGIKLTRVQRRFMTSMSSGFNV